MSGELECVARVQEAQELIFEAAERMALLHEVTERLLAHDDFPAAEASATADRLMSEGVGRLISSYRILLDVCQVAAGHESSTTRAARLLRQSGAIERDRVRRQGPLAAAVCVGAPGLARCRPRLVVSNTG